MPAEAGNLNPPPTKSANYHTILRDVPSRSPIDPLNIGMVNRPRTERQIQIQSCLERRFQLSSLTALEKEYFVKAFSMESGYVLNFTNATFHEFFQDYNVDIYDERFRISGDSKAKRMRAFWHLEPDEVVGDVLSGMLDLYEAIEEREDRALNERLMQRCREAIARLRNDTSYASSSTSNSSESAESAFLNQEFDVPNMENLPVEHKVVDILQHRVSEAQVCLSAGAYLAVIFLCGSVLEGSLLGLAINQPEKFNRSKACPKEDGKPKQFHRWSLFDLINVANETGFLKDDVKKFSHGLRDFRNYIHPYAEMTSEFQPDEYTAKLCFQALKAALADLSGQR